ncbi:MAG TPA: protein translocase subunit SecF [Candidatus Pacearchaeota archaeon]|nr:protein translocase subunit SecF [Candidatus Pacearchaeota archaeon]
MIDFLKYKNVYLIFSGILVLLSILAIGMWNFNYGIDFSQGSVLKIEYIQQKPSDDQIKEVLRNFEIQNPSVRPTGEKSVEITFKEIKSEEIKTAIKEALNKQAQIDEKKTSIEEVSPTVGKIVRIQTRNSIILSTLMILFFITLSFRGVSRLINSWYYALAATIAVLHDVLIPAGVMAYLGKFYGVQFTLPIVAALLTIFGYSINDTIVVFDRIREKFLRREGTTYEEVINKGITETAWRSIATTLTTLIPLFILYFIGGEELKYFALVLLIGISLGAYSSIFLASPLLVVLSKKNQIDKI